MQERMTVLENREITYTDIDYRKIGRWMQRLGEGRWPKFNRTQAKEREYIERINSSQEKIKNEWL